MLQSFHLRTKRKGGGLEGEEKCCWLMGPGRDIWSSVVAVRHSRQGWKRSLCVRGVQHNISEPNMGSVQLPYALS